MIQQQWQIYLNYYQRMEISSPKKRVNRDKCVFRDKTAYVWGLRYRWDTLLSRNLIPRFPHFKPPWSMLKFFLGLFWTPGFWPTRYPKGHRFPQNCALEPPYCGLTNAKTECLLYQKYDLILERAIKAGMANAKSEKALCKQRAFDEKYDVWYRRDGGWIWAALQLRTEAPLSYPRMQETLPAHTRMWQLLLLCVRHSYGTALAQHINIQTQIQTQI